MKKIKDGYQNLSKKLGTEDGITLNTVVNGELIDEVGIVSNIVNMPIQDAFLGSSIDSKITEVMTNSLLILRSEGIVVVLKNGVALASTEYTLGVLDINPLSATYMSATSITLTATGQTIQSDSFILLSLTASKSYKQMNMGKGVSIVEKVSDTVERYIISLMLATDIVGGLNQDVIRMDGLNDILMDDGEEDVIIERLNVISKYKSNMSTLLLDKNDEYNTVSKSLTGVQSVIIENAINVCAVSKIPYIRLFGKTTGGLSSGDSSIEIYYNTVVAEIRYDMNKISNFLYNKDIEFGKIIEPTEEEEQDALKVKIENYEKLFELGVIEEIDMIEGLRI